jgi:hypothetical protein
LSFFRDEDEVEAVSEVDEEGEVVLLTSSSASTHWRSTTGNSYSGKY